MWTSLFDAVEVVLDGCEAFSISAHSSTYLRGEYTTRRVGATAFNAIAFPTTFASYFSICS
jgi:hypothetical protein